MVSYSKSSAALFFASVISTASGHTVPKDFDGEKFKAELRQLRKDHSEILRTRVKSENPNNGNGDIMPGGDTVDTFLDGHEFIGPTGADVRAPCPFINCMANHGFINRSGKNVPAFNIPQLATILFDLPSDGFLPVVNLAIFDGQAVTEANGNILLDIDRLWDRPGEERDLSQIFPNPGLKFTEENLHIPESEGFEQDNDEIFLDFRYTISEEQLEDLLSRKTEDGFLTQQIHNEFLKKRVTDSLTPGNLEASFFRLSEEDIHVAGGQYTLPTLILGEDSVDFSFVRAENVERLWREFRFPDGYAPRSVRHGDAFDPVCYQAERLRFNEINEWTIKKALVEDALGKTDVSSETIEKVLAEIDENAPEIPERAELCEETDRAAAARKALRGGDAKIA